MVVNKAQEHLKKALMTAGLDEVQASNKVQGFSGIQVHTGIPRYCPRCRSKMIDVLLIGNRKARYCQVDRVVVPYPVEDVDSNIAYEEYMRDTVSVAGKGIESVFA